MPTAKQRAAAAKKAYKSVTSSTGNTYSPRAFLKNQNNPRVARIVGKSIARSAARPGKERTMLGSDIQKKALVHGPTAINYNKFAKKAIVHASLGEVQGMVKDIQRAYKKNLRKAR